MTSPQPSGPTPAQRAAFRRAALKALGLSLLGLAVTILGQQVPDRLYAALFAVASALLMAVAIGLAVAAYFVGSYHEDRAALASRTANVWDYLRRAGAWGLAAGGVGALLAGALPPRLSEAGSTDPAALPTAGFVAIMLGGAGFAYGLLEEWRERIKNGAHDEAS